MLDTFEIVTTTGVVLWSRNYVHVGANLLNTFIRDVFIEEKVPADTSSGVSSYRKEKHTLKWTFAKDLGLIFVAAYQSILHLSWVDKLLENVRTIFIDLYGEQVRKPNTAVVECTGFDAYFDQQLGKLEVTGQPVIEVQQPSSTKKAVSPPADISDDAPPPVPGLLKAQARSVDSNVSSTEVTPDATPNTSRPSTPGGATATLPKGSRRSRKAVAAAAIAAAAAANQSSGDESRRAAKTSKAGAKKMRKWDADGYADEDDSGVLDYSASAPNEDSTTTHDASGDAALEDINTDDFGTRNAKGDFVLKDLNLQVDAILKGANNSNAASETGTSAGLSAISGFFKNIVGGKTLTKVDLEKPMKAMQEHLVNKNIAQEAAIRLCEGVERELTGVKTGSFERVDTTIRAAMTSSLQKILTPTTSLDLLRSIDAVTKPSALNPLSSSRRPYVISIVGVNGVGKSTNLSKLAFFLLLNKKNILIAACDTFRSGAVEQLRVHARNLKELAAREHSGSVELFEKGYGKDAANIAKDAVAYATANELDVVLVDTAGRRHNDQRLMSSLEKFAQFAQPDKIFMVGEALVGSDSVAQARNFNAAFGAQRGLDGFIITKCDTVGDMVGSLVSMVHATGIPIVFVGVGQHYEDLRTLNVGWAVDLLMK